MFVKEQDVALHTREQVMAHINHDVLVNICFICGIYLAIGVLAATIRKGMPELQSLLRWMVAFAAYLYIGAAIFPYLEQFHEVEDRAEVRQLLTSVRGNLTEEAFSQVEQAFGGPGWERTTTTDLNWTFDGAAFFAFTLMTTIGYGSFCPKTHAGRLMTICYAPFGIAIAAITYVKLAEQVLSLVESVAFSLMHVDPLKVAFDAFDVDDSGGLSREELTLMVEELGARLTPLEFEGLLVSAVEAQGGALIATGSPLPAIILGDERQLPLREGQCMEIITLCGFAAALKQRPDLKKKVLSRSLEVWRWTFAFVLFGAMLVMSTLLSMWSEEWGWLESTYFTVVTFTTIGLGDATPSIAQVGWNKR
ncbi:hypothetical protein T492DRAFT_1139301 [Pavlovales sp. CCMP2436]|nr:hypothetical protein T492DRAFT_1139301 [Pavlovales sp. CCMP2436]